MSHMMNPADLCDAHAKDVALVHLRLRRFNLSGWLFGDAVELLYNPLDME